VVFQKSVGPGTRFMEEIRKEKFEESKARVEQLLNRDLFSVNSSQSAAHITLNFGQSEVQENADQIYALSNALSKLASQL